MIFRILVLAWLCLSTANVFAQESPTSLLNKIITKGFQQSYLASAVYIRPSGMETVDIEYDGQDLRITSRFKEQESTVTALHDRVINQIADAVSIHKSLKLFKPLRYLHKNIGAGLNSYDLFIGDDYGQVAGRQAVRFSIIPKVADRYSYIHWVDKETYIVLRTDTLDEKGNLIGRMLFTSFALKKQGELVIEDSIGSNSKLTVLNYQSMPLSDNSESPVKWMPAGFDVFTIDSIYDDKQQLIDKRIVLTDGLASIVIFFRANNHVARYTRGQQLDAFHVFKKTKDDKQISIEGKMPYAVLEKIAESMEIGTNHD